MPLTVLHYPVAYFVYKLDKRLSLPGLVVGCMFPDIEIPFMVFLFGIQGPNRMILHSLLGSATVGTFLAFVATILIYPFFVSRIFPVDEKRVEIKCKPSFALAFSVFVGNLSHVLLDMTNHPYNPVFWPFLPAIAMPNPIYFALGYPLGSLWMQIIMAALLFALIVNKRNNLFNEFLAG